VPRDCTSKKWKKHHLKLVLQPGLRLSHRLIDWKITLTFEKSKKEDMGNYRPVSLTSMPSKVVEQILLEAILKQVEN